MAADGRPRRAVFLDRDGVINHRAVQGDYIHRWGEFELLPGALAALVALHRAGGHLFVVTNQRGIARGLVNEADVAEIHARLSEVVTVAGARLEGVDVCPHEVGTCDCRKPETGLFRQAQHDHPWISFGAAHLVGDSLSDLEAGRRLGMRLWLVGDEHADLAREASMRGIEIAASSPSLSALVEAGGLTAALAAR